jgi:hypothetical protein
MNVDLEADLRREFDAASMPSSLNFHPESVVRQGRQTIRRRRTLVRGSAALAIALVGGASLLNRPHDSAAPQPPRPTATSSIVRAELDGSFAIGKFEIELNRDPKVTSNVGLFVLTEGRARRAVGAWSTGKPGQKPDATWKSGMVDGHPFTVGLIPGTPENIDPAGNGFYGYTPTKIRGTLYTAFVAEYTQFIGNSPNDIPKEATRPAAIASISWSGPTGIVDGIEGGHRLAGWVIALDNRLSVKVMLRPVAGGRTTVFGQVDVKGSSGDMSSSLSVATSPGPSGAAVVTGRQGIMTNSPSELEGHVGTPIAAGILPAGASDIDVILTTGELASGLPLSERLADGRVVFVMKVEGAQPSVPSEDSIRAVTWTNADGSPGRKEVTQKTG